jgi:hypothetical protein
MAGRTALIVFIFVLLFFAVAGALPVHAAVHAIAPNSWVTKAPMTQARGGLGVAVVNGKIYVIGGSTQNGVDGQLLSINEEYDPATNTWVTRAPMPTPRTDFAIAAYQNRIYCIGGISGQGRNFPIPGGTFLIASLANEVYDTATDTWATKAPMPFRMYYHLTTSVVGGKIYIIDITSTQPDLIYDPSTDSWMVQATNSPTTDSWNNALLEAFNKTADYASEYGPNQFASAAAGNKIYTVPIGYRALLIYDSVNGNWSLGTPAPSDITESCAAAATSGLVAPERIYFLGPTANYAYNHHTDGWQAGVPMPTNRVDFGVAVWNDQLYVVGGYAFDSGSEGYVAASAINEQYTPIGYGITPPEVSIISPVNKEYNTTNLSLIFAVDKPVNWTGYSLDGKENATIAGNTTLTGLSGGEHYLTVYANDSFDNTGASQAITFTIPSKPFSTPPIAVALTASVAIIGAGLIIYFKKYRHKPFNRTSKVNVAFCESAWFGLVYWFKVFVLTSLFGES